MYPVASDAGARRGQRPVGGRPASRVLPARLYNRDQLCLACAACHTGQRTPAQLGL